MYIIYILIQAKDQKSLELLSSYTDSQLIYKTAQGRKKR